MKKPTQQEEFSDQFFAATEGRNDKRREKIREALSAQRQETHKGESWRKGYQQGVKEGRQEILQECIEMLREMQGKGDLDDELLLAKAIKKLKKKQEAEKQNQSE